MDKFQNLTLKSPHTPIEYKTWSVFKYDFDMTIVLISQIQIFLIIFRRISILKEIFFVFFLSLYAVMHWLGWFKVGWHWNFKTLRIFTELYSKKHLPSLVMIGQNLLHTISIPPAYIVDSGSFFPL